MLEGKFSKNMVTPWLTEQGIFQFKKPQGRFVTRKGIADYQLCVRGQYVALELKTDFGTLSDAQKKERQLVRASEGIYMVGRPKTWHAVRAWLTELKHRHKIPQNVLDILAEVL